MENESRVSLHLDKKASLIHYKAEQQKQITNLFCGRAIFQQQIH